MRKNSVKNRRINEEVQVSLAKILRSELKDPRVSPMTSVLSVEVAPDLKTCKVYVSVYGDRDTALRTMEGIRSAKGFIRSALAKDVNLRNTPELTFILDESIRYGVEMSRKIDDVMSHDRSAALERGDREPGSGTAEEE